jgi:hypothetical protein
LLKTEVANSLYNPCYTVCNPNAQSMHRFPFVFCAVRGPKDLWGAMWKVGFLCLWFRLQAVFCERILAQLSAVDHDELKMCGSVRRRPTARAYTVSITGLARPGTAGRLKLRTAQRVARM